VLKQVLHFTATYSRISDNFLSYEHSLSPRLQHDSNSTALFLCYGRKKNEVKGEERDKKRKNKESELKNTTEK
jgi:hypothetical protein